jgi:isoquinoline 1-oxidoreductase subunit alpha
MITIKVNRTIRRLDVEPEMPLLWVLRDELGLTGTKYGCGSGQCGACTVHVNGDAIRSCLTQVGAVTGKEITTIEGLSSDRRHSAATASRGGWCPRPRFSDGIRSQRTRT